MVEVEVEIVGKDNVVERFAIAGKLFAVLAPAIEVGVAEVFRLYKSRGLPVSAAHYDEVRGSACYAAWLVGHVEIGQEGVEQLFQGWAVAVLACHACGQLSVQFGYVFLYGHACKYIEKTADGKIIHGLFVALWPVSVFSGSGIIV